MVSASSASQTLIILALFLLQASGAPESKFPPITNCGVGNVRNREMLIKISNVQFEVAALTALSGFVHSKIDGVAANGRCQRDLNKETCAACIASAVTTLRQSCPHSTMSRTWMEKCYVDYSTNAKKLEEGRLGFADALCSNTPLSIQRKIFEGRMNRLLSSVITAAKNDDERYASQEMQLSTKLFMYGMAQCNGDYTSDMCGGCLDSALKKGKGSCWGKEGFHIMGTGCVLRLENYNFVNTKYYP